MVWRKVVHGGNTFEAITLIAGILLLFSFYNSNYWLIFLGSFLLVLSRMSLYYLNHVADELVFDNRKETTRLSIGEESICTLNLSQHSRLPVLKAHFKIKLEGIVEGVGVPTHHSQSDTVFTIPIYLQGRETVQIPIPVKALRRGATRIKSMELVIQNFFGFGHLEISYIPFIQKEIIVHPTPIAVPQVDKLFATNSQGDYTAPRSINEHLLAPIGTRDYVYTDSFQRIHWKASAKTQSLQTKVFERTAHYSWTFIVNLREPNLPTYHLGVVENIESIASNIAYMAQFATKKGIEFELFLNLRMASENVVYHLPKGGGAKQLAKVLDTLARITDRGNTMPINKLFRYVEKQQQNSPVVIFSGPSQEVNDHYFTKMQMKGQNVYLLHDDEEHPAIIQYGRN